MDDNTPNTTAQTPEPPSPQQAPTQSSPVTPGSDHQPSLTSNGPKKGLLIAIIVVVIVAIGAAFLVFSKQDTAKKNGGTTNTQTTNKPDSELAIKEVKVSEQATKDYKATPASAELINQIKSQQEQYGLSDFYSVSGAVVYTRTDNTPYAAVISWGKLGPKYSYQEMVKKQSDFVKSSTPGLQVNTQEAGTSEIKASNGKSYSVSCVSVSISGSETYSYGCQGQLSGTSMFFSSSVAEKSAELAKSKFNTLLEATTIVVQ